MTTAEKITFTDLEELMNSHWGSEQFFRHAIIKKLIYTEGIKHFAQVAGAYWFIDMVASYMYNITKNNVKKQDYFNLVRISVKDDRTASFSVKHDRGENAFIRQQIPFTDLPIGTYEFYLIGNDEYYTLLLKNEY